MAASYWITGRFPQLEEKSHLKKELGNQEVVWMFLAAR